MKLKELMEKRAALVAKLNEARAKGTDKLTAEERSACEASLAEISALDKTLELENRMALAAKPSVSDFVPKTEKRQYQIRNIILRAIGENVDCGFENEVTQELSKRTGLTPQGGILVPFERRADNTTVNMAATIATDVAQPLPYLYPVTVFDRLGVRNMTNLVGDMIIPVSTTVVQGTSKGETAAADQIQYTWTQIKMTPHRLPVEVRVSRQSLLQNASMESFVQDDIRNGMAAKFEYYGLQGTGANGDPLGLLNHTISTRSNANTTWTLTDAVAVPNTILENNIGLMGPINWLCRPSAATFIESKPVATNASNMVMQNGQMAGYPVIKTTNLPANTSAGCLVAGPWDNLIVGTWGAMELIVDPLTLANTGMVKLLATTYYDIGVMRPLSFVKNSAAISA